MRWRLRRLAVVGFVADTARQIHTRAPAGEGFIVSAELNLRTPQSGAARSQALPDPGPGTCPL